MMKKADLFNEIRENRWRRVFRRDAVDARRSMANFQIIFSGNEEELYRFVLTWKMSSDVKRYDELKQQLQELEDRVKELRERVKELEEERMRLRREISELTALRESLRREVSLKRGEGARAESGL